MSPRISIRYFAAILIAALSFGGSAVSTFGQSAPAISTKTPTTSTLGSTFFVSLPITNTGGTAAGSVEITSATLGTASLLSPSLPLAAGTLAAGSTYALNLGFAATSLTAGKNYLLNVRGTYQTSSNSTAGFSVNRFISYSSSNPFGQPPNPLTVTPTPDAAHAASQTINAANGGTITATGSDGSVFTLAIPPNALLNNELITLTPLSAVANLPISGGLLAGVELSPDGLRFQQNATLTIQPAATVPVAQQVGFGFHGAGQEFYFQPPNATNTITFTISHFSGAGVGQGTAGNGGNPTSVADQLSQQANQIVAEERACQLGVGACDPNYPQDLINLLQDYYTEVLTPLIQQALTDDSVAQAAVDAITSFARIEALVAGDAQLDGEAQSALAQVQAIVENVYNKAFGRCANDTSEGERMVEAQKMIAAEKTLQILFTDQNPNFASQVAACIAGPIDFSFDSSVNGNESIPGAQTFFSDSVVQAQQIPLTFDTTSLAYTGNGPLDYVSHNYSVDWNLPGTDCSSGVGISGTIGITAIFDLNVSPFDITSANQLRLYVSLIPQVAESDTLCLEVAGGTVSSTATDADYGIYFSVSIGGLAATQNAAPPEPFYVNLNTPQEFNVSGSTSDGGIDFTGFQDSTVTLEQTSP